MSEFKVESCRRCNAECPPSDPSLWLNDDAFGLGFYARFTKRHICGLCAAELLRLAAARCEAAARRWDWARKHRPEVAA